MLAGSGEPGVPGAGTCVARGTCCTGAAGGGKMLLVLASGWSAEAESGVSGVGGFRARDKGDGAGSLLPGQLISLVT